MKEPVSVPISCLTGLRVPLRDGVHLAADLWKPHEHKTGCATVVTLTPYGRDTCTTTARLFASWGFAFVALDCRGRGESEGEFALYGDSDDYAQAVQWLAAQPWCSGNIFTQGGSYAGINQWQVATRLPVALKAIAPMVAPLPGWDSDYWGGISRTGNIDWCTLVEGRSTKWGIFSSTDFLRQLHGRVWKAGTSRKEMATLLTTSPNPLIAAVMKPFRKYEWDYAVPTKSELSEMHIPALSITGLYDNAQVGAILYFEQHVRATSQVMNGKQFLVIGPCTHAGARPTSPDDDGNMEGVALVTDRWQDELCAAFYRYALGEAVRPAVLKACVNVFVSGLERWVHSPTVEALSDYSLELFPGTEGLASAPDSEMVMSLTSDPLDSRFADLEASGQIRSTLNGLTSESPLDTDYADSRYLFDQGLVWDTAPFSKDIYLCGRPDLSLDLSTDLPDADLLASVLKIRPNGQMVALSCSMLRLRHRDGFDEVSRSMPLNVKERITFPLWRLTAARLETGSRIRLVLRVPASIDFERQFNAEKPVAEQVIKDAQIGKIFVHAGASTKLRLPVLNPDLPQSAP